MIESPEPLLLFHLCATWAMVGIIWFVQIIHYPLFDKISSQCFPEYERSNCNRTSFVVLPFMLVEFVSALLLTVFPPATVGSYQLAIGCLLLIAIWLSTFLMQVPLHNKLSMEFDAVVCRKLVDSNWIRTLAWTLRGLLAAIWVLG